MASLLSRLAALEATHLVANSHKWLFITTVKNRREEGVISVVYDIGSKSSLRMENPDKLPAREFIKMCEDAWGVDMMDDYFDSPDPILWMGESQVGNGSRIRLH